MAAPPGLLAERSIMLHTLAPLAPGEPMKNCASCRNLDLDADGAYCQRQEAPLDPEAIGDPNDCESQLPVPVPGPGPA